MKRNILLATLVLLIVVGGLYIAKPDLFKGEAPGAPEGMVTFCPPALGNSCESGMDALLGICPVLGDTCVMEQYPNGVWGHLWFDSIKNGEFDWPAPAGTQVDMTSGEPYPTEEPMLDFRVQVFTQNPLIPEQVPDPYLEEFVDGTYAIPLPAGDYWIYFPDAKGLIQPNTRGNAWTPEEGCLDMQPLDDISEVCFPNHMSSADVVAFTVTENEWKNVNGGRINVMPGTGHRPSGTTGDGKDPGDARIQPIEQPVDGQIERQPSDDPKDDDLQNLRTDLGNTLGVDTNRLAAEIIDIAEGRKTVSADKVAAVSDLVKGINANFRVGGPSRLSTQEKAAIQALCDPNVPHSQLSTAAQNVLNTLDLNKASSTRTNTRTTETRTR